jgi:two-component sensor histidine kinase
MDARRKPEIPHWPGNSDVAQLIRARDWSPTPLGALETWSPCLRTVLDVCLNSTSPVAVYWGKELLTLYNDACAYFIGDKHPAALGLPAPQLYAEIWHSIGPLFEKTLKEGVSTSSRNQPRPLNRDGRREEHLFDITLNPVRDEFGHVAGILVFAFEVSDHVRTAQALATEMTELQRLQSQQRVLVCELQHRTRNLLAVVRAIASQTFGDNADAASLGSFLERLSALGRVQGLIGRADRQRVKLSDIVWAELEAYIQNSPSRLEVHGPVVRLANHQVQTIALALHELVTNAVKYGALKTPTGRLSVTWETWLGVNGQQRFALLWRESGVLMPPQPVTRRGHGRELIENALRFSLHADTQLVFGQDGVWCRIELPVDGGTPTELDPVSLGG